MQRCQQKLRKDKQKIMINKTPRTVVERNLLQGKFASPLHYLTPQSRCERENFMDINWKQSNHLVASKLYVKIFVYIINIHHCQPLQDFRLVEITINIHQNDPATSTVFWNCLRWVRSMSCTRVGRDTDIQA